MRTVIIAPTPSQPRFHKRAEALLEYGTVDVYAFDRGYYRGNVFPTKCAVTLLPPIRNGHYVSRIGSIFRAMRDISRSEASKPRPDLVYSFGLDNALLGSMAFKGVPLVYELGDIRRVQTARGLKGVLSRGVERGVARRALATVVTSPAFLYEYLIPSLGLEESKGLLLENRVSSSLRPGMRPKNGIAIVESPIKLGIVGNLRYEGTMRNFLDALIGLSSKYELHVFGEGPASKLYFDYSERVNIVVHGPFLNPADLRDVYSSIHLNVVLYDNHDRNVRWAIPNKLFESVFFGVPLLVSAQTALSERVRMWGVGYETDPTSPRAITHTLLGITPGDIHDKSCAALQVPSEEIVDHPGVVVRALDSRLRAHGKKPTVVTSA